jgi:hypothetical protein
VAPEILKIPIHELSTTILTLFLLHEEPCFKSVTRRECASAGARRGRRSEILKLANIQVGVILSGGLETLKKACFRFKTGRNTRLPVPLRQKPWTPIYPPG